MTKSNFKKFLIGLLALLITACGSSSDFNGYDPNYPYGTNFAGNYSGSNPLDGGQSSILSLSVQENGDAAGTLTVQGPSLPAQAYTLIPTGNYPVSGSVNMLTGEFSLLGSFFGTDDFTISGNLATGSLTGSYSLNFNGNVYSGTISPASSGGGGTPPSGDGSLYSVQSGVLSSFTFSPDGSYSGANPPVTEASTLISGAVQTGSSDTNSVTIAIAQPGSTPGVFETLIVGVALHNGQDLEVGHTYSIANASGDGAIVSLSETNGTTINNAWTLTPSTTGAFTVNSMSETSIDVTFSFNNVGPNTEVSGNGALGGFSTSGHVTATLVNSEG